MANNVSLQHTVVRINGHTHEGWAAQSDALTLPDITVAATEVGPDGLMVASSTGMRGGEVVMKFLANSRTRAFYGQQMSEIQRGAVKNFSGSIANSQTGETTRLDRGVLISAPSGTTLGNAVPPSRDVTIMFESVISNFDGFNAQPAPVLAA